MSATKELGKFEVAPTIDQLMAVVQYFEKNATESGRVNFTQKQMLEDPNVAPHFNTPSTLNGVTTYLANEGFVTKIQIGARRMNSIWDVSKLIADWDKVETRESLGSSRPNRDAKGNLLTGKKVEVEVVSSSDRAPSTSSPEVIAPKKAQSPKGNNVEIMTQLKSTMDDMLGYLQALPAEMSGHLRSISNQLELTDENALSRLQDVIESLNQEKSDWQKEREGLLNQITSLESDLEESAKKSSYNTHQIYRQRNAIMDEVDRMISGPSWTIRQNGTAIRNNIESKLDSIMKEIGIDVK